MTDLILDTIFFDNSIKEYLFFLSTLIIALILVGQFFFSYHLHNVFNRLSKIDGPYSIQEHEEYVTYLILAALLIIYLFFI